MNRVLLPAVALAFAVGCSSTVSGTVVDGLTGKEIPGKAADAGDTVQPNRLVAKATTTKKDENGNDVPAYGLSCTAFSSEIGQDGSYTLSGLCLGESDYSLSIEPDKNYFLADRNTIKMGEKFDGPVTIKAYRAPNGTAVNILRKDGVTLDPIRSRQKIKSETITGTEEKVYYPQGIKGVPMMEAGEYLVLSGAANADMQLHPLVNSGARVFKTDEVEVKMQPWSYIGTSFTDDENFERVSAKLDASKVTKVESGGHVVTFIPTEALGDKGRYALFKEGMENTYLIDIGAKGEMPKAETAEEGENAGGE